MLADEEVRNMFLGATESLRSTNNGLPPRGARDLLRGTAGASGIIAPMFTSGLFSNGTFMGGGGGGSGSGSHSPDRASSPIESEFVEESVQAALDADVELPSGCGNQVS